MWHSWSDCDMHRVHFEDLRRAADQARLVALARAARPPQARLHGRVLCWLGRRMIAWGTNLQKRYSAGIGPFVASADKPRQRAAASVGD